MEEFLCRIDRAHRGLRGDHLTAGGTGQNPKRSGGPKRQRRMAKAGYFGFAMQRRRFLHESVVGMNAAGGK